MIMATLETAKAIDNAAAIAAVPGIDVLTMGMNDLSVDLGIPGQLGHERMATRWQVSLVRACGGQICRLWRRV